MLRATALQISNDAAVVTRWPFRGVVVVRSRHTSGPNDSRSGIGAHRVEMIKDPARLGLNATQRRYAALDSLCSARRISVMTIVPTVVRRERSRGRPCRDLRSDAVENETKHHRVMGSRAKGEPGAGERNNLCCSRHRLPSFQRGHDATGKLVPYSGAPLPGITRSLALRRPVDTWPPPGS